MYTLLFLKCFVTGLFLHEVSGQLRIVGGLDAPEMFGLFHASLQNVTGHHVCGGAIVSEWHVVTAAHCLKGANPQFIKVVVGTTNLDEGGVVHDAVAINIYHDYNSSSRNNDIALLTVNVPFSSNCVHILELGENELVEGDSVYLTGFGAVKPNGAPSRQMHILQLPVFNQNICRYAMRYSIEVLDNMFCTFTRVGEGTCHGDSGGPLVKDNKLVGLVSWGIPCAVGFPDVHTRITPYIGWIGEQIRTKRCTSRNLNTTYQVK